MSDERSVGGAKVVGGLLLVGIMACLAIYLIVRSGKPVQMAPARPFVGAASGDAGSEGGR